MADEKRKKKREGEEDGDDELSPCQPPSPPSSTSSSPYSSGSGRPQEGPHGAQVEQVARLRLPTATAGTFSKGRKKPKKTVVRVSSAFRS
jgi:hypothetical protein